MESALHALALIIQKVESAEALRALVVGGARGAVGWALATSVGSGLDIKADVALAAISLYITNLAVGCAVATIVVTICYIEISTVPTFSGIITMGPTSFFVLQVKRMCA